MELVFACGRFSGSVGSGGGCSAQATAPVCGTSARALFPCAGQGELRAGGIRWWEGRGALLEVSVLL